MLDRIALMVHRSWVVQPRGIEAGFCLCQKAFCCFHVGIFAKINEMLYQVASGYRTLIDFRHQRCFCLASSLAKTSLRIPLQSAEVSSLSGLLKPSSNLASSYSSALRFSSARINSRIYSLALLLGQAT